jgi:pimeloyl-ACP methyl ester carboxylesterase
MSRILAAAGAMLLVMGAASCGSDDPEPRAAPSSPPTPAMHLECSGAGGPTVVLLAGLDTSGDTFTSLAAELAGSAEACWYDRAGTGSSPALPDAAPDPSPGSSAVELHDTLVAQGVEAPYVVLGWSYGGLVAQAFQARYPSDVAGLVLEDTAVAEQFTDPEMRETDEGQGVVWSEGGRDVDTEALLTDVADLDFADAPVAVLSQDVTGPWAEKWYAAHDRLARLSSDSVHVVGVGAGHVMHEDAPLLVSEAVEAIVAAVRQGTPVAPCDERFTGVGGRCRTP